MPTYEELLAELEANGKVKEADQGFFDEDEVNATDTVDDDEDAKSEDTSDDDDSSDDEDADETESDEETGNDEDSDEEDAEETDEESDEDDSDEEEDDETDDEPSALTEEDLSRTTTLTINGQKVEKSLAEVIKDAELAAGARGRFEEAKAIREEAAGAIAFSQELGAKWQPEGKSADEVFESRADLINTWAEQAATTPNDKLRLWAKFTESIAATGGFSSPEGRKFAEALNINDSEVAALTNAHFQKKQAAEAEARAAADRAETERRNSASQIETDIITILEDANLVDAPVEEKKAYLDKVFDFAKANNLNSPAGIHRAHARFQLAQAAEVKKTASTKVDRAARAERAVAKAASTKAKKVASLSTSTKAKSATEPDPRSGVNKAYDFFEAELKKR